MVPAATRQVSGIVFITRFWRFESLQVPSTCCAVLTRAAETHMKSS
jgi:hypothetical protein